MKNILLRLFFNAIGLLLIAEYVPGIHVDGFYPALIAAFVLGFLNIFLRPILLILTFPITVITLGLFSFVINAFLFLFVASFVEGFKVDGFKYALFGSFCMSVISTIGNRWIVGSSKPKVVYREVRD